MFVFIDILRFVLSGNRSAPINKLRSFSNRHLLNQYICSVGVIMSPGDLRETRRKSTKHSLPLPRLLKVRIHNNQLGSSSEIENESQNGKKTFGSWHELDEQKIHTDNRCAWKFKINHIETSMCERSDVKIDKHRN